MYRREGYTMTSLSLPQHHAFDGRRQVPAKENLHCRCSLATPVAVVLALAPESGHCWPDGQLPLLSSQAEALGIPKLPYHYLHVWEAVQLKF